MNDLPGCLTTSAKIFRDDTSLFLMVNDPAASSASLINNLMEIYQWAYQ